MIIIQDTREKTPWNFDFYGGKQKVGTLKTGDYSIEGFEDQFCIERKRSTGEISMNLGTKRKAFENEMARMMSFKKKYLIFEFSINDLLDFPARSGIPPYQLKYVRMNAGFMISSLEKLEEKYGFEVIYCNNTQQATETAFQLITEFYEQATIL